MGVGKTHPISLPFLFWGGSPSRILGYSSNLPALFKRVMDAERRLQSSDPEYTALLRSGERSWIDVPFQTGENRLFVTSMLFEEPGVRPEWHFLALSIGKHEWRVIGSHRRLWRALNRYSPSGWKEFFRKDSEKIELMLDGSAELPSLKEQLPRNLPSCETEALEKLERGCLFSEDRSFAEDKVAWNPAVLNAGWKCVVTTRKRTGLKEEAFSFPWEKRLAPETGFTSEKVDPPRSKRKTPLFGRKRFLLIGIFVASIALGLFFLFKDRYFYEKPILKNLKWHIVSDFLIPVTSSNPGIVREK